MLKKSNLTPRLISVCICTYKRFNSLLNTVESVLTQTLPSGFILELIVVDNDANSVLEDNLKIAVQKNITSQASFTYVIEVKSGVANARNRCLDEAKGELIAFIDDDEVATSNWLINMVNLLQSTKAEAVFGPVCSKFVVEPPVWLKVTGAHNRPRFKTGHKITWTDARTGNVLFNSKGYFKNKRFNLNYTNTGGEDSFFFAEAYLAGAVYVWCDEAEVFEEVPVDRMTKKWVLQRAFYGGRTYARLQRDLYGNFRLANNVFRGVIGVLIYTPLSCIYFILGNCKYMRYMSKVCAGTGKVAFLYKGGAYGEVADA